MSESTTPAQCRDDDWGLARDCGLMAATPGTNEWDAALGRFADGIRATPSTVDCVDIVRAVVYPPDGTTSPFTVINLGSGQVQMGDCTHDHRLPALWFGKDGKGLGHEEVLNREAKDGETIAVVTFSNVDGLDVLLDVVHRIRRDSFAGAATATSTSPDPFQARVQPWMLECFGAEIAADKQERNHRFLEESLELVQACGATASEAHQLVDYVYGRPVGDKHQEVGGVMVTLAALCLAQGLDMHTAGETELARIWTKVEQIRAKQAAKPKHSPLPEHAPATGADYARTLLTAASHALRSYQYGNAAPDLAESIAGRIDAALRAIRGDA
ncbi:hypothetical protein D9M69_118990 [compost metagenome]